MAMTPCIEPFFFSVVKLSSFAKKGFFLNLLYIVCVLKIELLLNQNSFIKKQLHTLFYLCYITMVG